ncbi:hypothetical protein [Actinomyces bowdenii]|uniref:Transposase n=1 Tax=Actinomyces bowdenii TaxID=131109 RepID=A0A853EN21_9ACTO|nr:hypothetical protein [Actinomyces bowdenii]MBF0696993.1 hypothetical protein [Actinomyces bowdenii]NYS69166.1 hypothetical protein [Actinomyces bowdenii]
MSRLQIAGWVLVALIALAALISIHPPLTLQPFIAQLIAMRSFMAVGWGILGLHGIRRAKSPHTTRSAPREQCPADLVKRNFSAFRPNELWVADITYVRTFSGGSMWLS